MTPRRSRSGKSLTPVEQRAMVRMCAIWRNALRLLETHWLKATSNGDPRGQSEWEALARAVARGRPRREVERMLKAERALMRARCVEVFAVAIEVCRRQGSEVNALTIEPELREAVCEAIADATAERTEWPPPGPHSDSVRIDSREHGKRIDTLRARWPEVGIDVDAFMRDSERLDALGERAEAFFEELLRQETIIRREWDAAMAIEGAFRDENFPGKKNGHNPSVDGTVAAAIGATARVLDLSPATVWRAWSAATSPTSGTPRVAADGWRQPLAAWLEQHFARREMENEMAKERDHALGYG